VTDPEELLRINKELTDQVAIMRQQITGIP